MNRPISTGTSVTESSAAAAMASVLVHASGSKRRPSCASSAKTGMNESVMIRSEVKSAGPTSWADSVTRAQWPLGRPSRSLRSMCLWRFSTITMAASIMAPMAMAMPPSDMMLAPIPSQRMARNAIRMPMGSVTSATSALLAWRRKTRVTSATISDSSISFSRSVRMARPISPERSYPSTKTTPAGSASSSSAIRFFTPSITSSGFSP